MSVRLGETNADGEETVAVIGSGISGLASAWLLARQGKRVTLFESEETLGGHALTAETKIAGPIDLGFQVCNLTNYPHLFGFFDQLGIDTVESDMSFALSTPTCEWGSRSLGAIFATPGSATSPAHWRMLRDVLAFGRQAPEVLRSPEAWVGVTLGEYLARRRYSSEFVLRYVVPMTAAVWSCSDAQALEFPVVPLIRFWSNHHLLSILERPVWRVVEGRSQAYVAAAAAAIKDVRTGSRVEEVRRVAGGEGGCVAVRVAGEARECRFDAVVLATHSDVSLSLLGDGASAAERAVLGAIRYSSNEVYVHTDASLMPRARATWASWNCIKTERPDEATAAVCVSYWVNLLQNLPAGTQDLFVTLNPPSPPDAAKTVRRVQLAHPLFDGAAVAAQARVGGLQGSGGVYFCGAWCGYGFHEDGIASAVRAVEALCGGGPVVPWEPFSCDAKMGLVPRACLSLFLRFGDAMLSRGGAIRLILPTGADCWLGDRAAPPEQTAVVRVRRASLFQKVVCKSDIGLGEAYMDGDYAGDVFKLLLLLSRSSSGSPSQLRQATAGALGWAGGALHSLFERLERDAHYANSNTEEGSARNISYHYDAGNDFYKLILDETMLYSSAVFTPERAAALAALDAAGKEASLEEAQYEKIDAMIRAAQLRPGEHVLEIGCGWGACGVRMAQVAGVRVTGITISREQLAEARKRAREANMEHLVTFEFCDYRNVRGQFDKVVSIEMIEAVGHEHLPTFFAAVSRALKPGGLAAIQVITMPDERYEAYCNSHSDFIRTHIFPGGHLPSMGAMTAISSRLGLELHGAADVGDDYAITLRLWRERLTARARQIEALGYPRRFIRMYEFYFAYCEAGFANQLIHDYQLTFRKSPLPRPLPPPTDAAPTPVDPLTATLLLVWGGLTAALVASKPHMAIVPAALVAVLSACGLLRTFCGLAPFRAAAATAALAAALTAASSAALLIAAMATADLSAAAAPVAVTSRAARAAAKAAAKAAAAHSAAADPSSLPDVVASAVRCFVELLQRPSPPAPLQAAARAVVGSAAGCNAARAWEAVRHRQLRTDTFEGAASAVFLVVAAAALYHDIALLPIALAQLSEAHALLLRLRMLKRAPEPAATGQPQAPPGGGFGLGLAFLVLRAAPHAALIGATMPRLLAPGVERTAVTWAALLSVSVMVMHDGTVLLSEVRRHLLASRLAHLEGLTAGNHRKSS